MNLDLRGQSNVERAEQWPQSLGWSDIMDKVQKKPSDEVTRCWT